MRPGEIKIERLGKQYRFGGIRDGSDDDSDVMDEDRDDSRTAGIGAFFRSRKSEFWALRDISCHIAPGERVGIVGANGSGKSTLVQILSRILPPSEGEVTGAGVVVPFGALKKPVAPQASGVENIRLLARLLGIPMQRLDERLPEIVAFSGLGRLAQEKVSRYSDQSYARLSMAMGVFVDADIYLVDDDLKVGDEIFRDRFEDRLSAQLGKNVTLVYASNNIGKVRSYCTRALWLNQGRLAGDAEAHEAIRRFLASSDTAVDFADSFSPVAIPQGDGAPPDQIDAPHRLDRQKEWSDLSMAAQDDWNRARLAWKEKRRSQERVEIGGPLIVQQPPTLGNILTLVCLDEAQRPLRDMLPGEPFAVQFEVETYFDAVRIAVRLELFCHSILVFAAEPLVPFTAHNRAVYRFCATVPGHLWAYTSMRLEMKLRAVITFENEREVREQVKSAVRITLHGDVFHQFDTYRQSRGHDALSISAPAPGLTTGRVELAEPKPVLQPDLNWEISCSHASAGEETVSSLLPPTGTYAD